MTDLPLKVLSLAELLDDGLFTDGDWVESKDQDPDGEVRLIQLADVGDGVFRNRSSRFLTRRKAEELHCTFLEAGDILVARMPEPLGRACVFPGLDGPAVTVVDVCVLRPNPSTANAGWLVNAINSPRFRASMYEFIRGTTRQRISRKNLGALRLKVPSLADQSDVTAHVSQIAKIRMSATSHLAKGRSAVERSRQAVLAAACLGRLTEGEEQQLANPGEIHEILAGYWSTRKPRRQKEQPVELALPELPERFAVRPLGDCASAIEYGTSKRCSSDPEVGIPVLRMGNIQGGALDFGELKYCPVDHELDNLLLEDGDLLFNRTNSPELVGKAAVFHSAAKMSFASYLIRVRLLPEVAHPDYVNYWINSAWGRAWATLAKTDGVSQSNINGSKLALMPLPLPPYDEQISIVARASALLRVTDQLMVTLGKADHAVGRTAQAVLAEAFRGDLVPVGMMDD